MNKYYYIFYIKFSDSCKEDKSVQFTTAFSEEKTDLTRENSKVLSYQHFQQHLVAFPLAGFQTDNVHTDNSISNTNIKATTLTKLPKKSIEQDMPNSSWWDTNAHSNDFVNTQLVKCENDKTEEEEILFDPLQINISSVKVEPSGISTDIIVSSDERGLASDFVAVEMKVIKQSNSIPSDGDNEFSEDDGKTNIKLSIQTERKRIEQALQQENEMEQFLVMDIKAEVEELTWNPLQNNQNSTYCGDEAAISAEMASSSLFQVEPMRKNNNKIGKEPKKRNKRQRWSIAHAREKKYATQAEGFVHGKELNKIRFTRSKTKLHEPEGNPLHSYLDYSSCDEETSLSPKTLAQRATRSERMRKFHVKIKSDAMKRKARQRKSIEIARLSRVKTEEEDFFQEDRIEIEKLRLTRSKAKINESLDSGIAQNSFEIESTEEGIFEVHNQTNKSHQKKQHLTNEVDFDSDSSLAEKRKLWAARMRERRARETPEETEIRRLKARITKMKSRLLAQLIVSEEELKAENARKAEEMRLMRQKRREGETPEQTAARKLKQSLQARKSRNRLEAVETPEETAKRKAARAAYLKKRKEELKAKETPEEQALRKEQRKEQRRMYKERKIMQNVGAAAQKENTITIRETISNNLASCWTTDTRKEFNTFNNALGMEASKSQ